jgi:hypothetical protein
MLFDHVFRNRKFGCVLVLAFATASSANAAPSASHAPSRGGVGDGGAIGLAVLTPKAGAAVGAGDVLVEYEAAARGVICFTLDLSLGGVLQCMAHDPTTLTAIKLHGVAPGRHRLRVAFHEGGEREGVAQAPTEALEVDFEAVGNAAGFVDGFAAELGPSEAHSRPPRRRSWLETLEQGQRHDSAAQTAPANSEGVAGAAGGMRLVHPVPGAAFISDDVVVSLEFLPGLGPSADRPLWVRFDGPGNATGEDMVFTK